MIGWQGRLDLVGPLDEADPVVGSALGDTVVHITGSGFVGTTSVKLGGVDADFTVWSDTYIEATTPAHAAGRASIAFCAAAIEAAMAGDADAVAAAPQNETSIAQAGIRFDGHPSTVEVVTKD